MLLIIAVLLLALILFGVGFAVHVLWWIALIVLALCLLGFLFWTAEGGGSRRRWDRWEQDDIWKPGCRRASVRRQPVCVRRNDRRRAGTSGGRAAWREYPERRSDHAA